MILEDVTTVVAVEERVPNRQSAHDNNSVAAMVTIVLPSVGPAVRAS